jgi:hypothetical protein
MRFGKNCFYNAVDICLYFDIPKPEHAEPELLQCSIPLFVSGPRHIARVPAAFNFDDELLLKASKIGDKIRY